LDGDELSFISEFLPAESLAERLANLSGEEQSWVRTSLHYPSDSVGAYMGRDMVLVHEDETLKNVLKALRKKGELPEQCDKLFVINRHGELVGILPMEKLLLCTPSTQVADCMAADVVTFMPEENAFQAAGAFERYDLVSAPVVNERHRPVGRLTVDVIMDVVRVANTEDALNSAGLKREEDLFAPIWDSARNRWLWLSCSLLTAFLAAYVIGLFEETIARYVALAALMPIVAAIGGNTGNQTTTLVVRALALEQINRGNVRHLARKELGLSLLNGAVWGSVVGLFALLVYQDIQLAMVIALAMVITLILAALFALSIPLSLQYLNRDPALGSSVLVTAFTDSIGFFIFLGLATLLL
jgi:magnesium transporter